MASLRSSYGAGGSRVPSTPTAATPTSIVLSRRDLEQCIAQMPTDQCRDLHLAVRRGDLPTAQRLLREAAERYVATR